MLHAADKGLQFFRIKVEALGNVADFVLLVDVQAVRKVSVSLRDFLRVLADVVCHRLERAELPPHESRGREREEQSHDDADDERARHRLLETLVDRLHRAADHDFVAGFVVDDGFRQVHLVVHHDFSLRRARLDVFGKLRNVEVVDVLERRAPASRVGKDEPVLLEHDDGRPLSEIQRRKDARQFFKRDVKPRVSDEIVVEIRDAAHDADDQSAARRFVRARDYGISAAVRGVLVPLAASRVVASRF